MADVSNDFAPASFVSKKTLAAKDQKKHITYLKKKKNKINNATDQHEMPTANQYGEVATIDELVESVVSTLKSNYTPKGKKYITEFKAIPITKSTILSYKKGCPFLSHIRYGNNIDGCIFLDSNKVAGVISIESKNNGEKWLQAMEITKPYQGYGLARQFLHEAVIHYGARYLSVNKDNKVAIKVYEDYGFKPYGETDSMIFMKIDGPGTLRDINEMTLLEAASRKDMIPIFIVNSWTNTIGGKVIRVATHSTYTHSAISLDTSLERLYSFNADNKRNKYGGVSIESISDYIKVYDKCLINVKCIFIKKSDYDVIKNVLDHMISHQDETTYDYLNLFNILFGRVKEMTDFAMSMVCSQFVTYILARADIKLLDKSPNLTTPKDLVMTNNPKIYQLYEGLASEYDKKKIDRIFRKLKLKAVLIKESSL